MTPGEYNVKSKKITEISANQTSSNNPSNQNSNSSVNAFN